MSSRKSSRKLIGVFLALGSMGAYAAGCSSTSSNFGAGNGDSGAGGGHDSGGGQTDSSNSPQDSGSTGNDTGSSFSDSGSTGNDTGSSTTDTGTVTTDSSTTDTGTVTTDSSTKDTGPVGDAAKDTGTSNDSSMMCPDNSAFTAITWSPPTAFHQNKCTAAQATAYDTSLMGNGPFTSGNAACDACIQTDQAAAAHGPVVTVMTTPAELNIGGCIANETGLAGDKAAGGCGNQINNANDCILQECFDCADEANPTAGGPFDTCDQTVLGAGGVCAADGITMACQTEIGMDGGVQTCLNDTLVQLVTLWCGP